MPGIVCISVVFISTNGDATAVFGERDGVAKAVSCRLAIDVVADLIPGAAIPLVDAGMA